MWQKIFSTVGARYLVAFANLVMVIINAKALGLQQVGEIGLITAAVNLIITFNSLFTGSTLVYFLSHSPQRPVLLLAYGWSVAGTLLGAGFFLPVSPSSHPSIGHTSSCSRCWARLRM